MRQKAIELASDLNVKEPLEYMNFPFNLGTNPPSSRDDRRDRQPERLHTPIANANYFSARKGDSQKAEARARVAAGNDDDLNVIAGG